MRGDQSERVVFNLVWTGTVFRHLALFTESLLAHTGARVRFIGNACPREELDLMERFATTHPDRVVEVMDVSPTTMLRHGDALDIVRRQRDDGGHFALIDPDIFLRAPVMGRFDALLEDHDVVTSGKELWSRTNVRPDGHPGVNGEYFFDLDGYTFGSPHFAIYRREALDATIERWGVGFSSAGGDISAEARRRLVEVGRDYWIFDTAKIVNVLIQADGGTLVHEEHPDLVHIGGVSHFISPPTGDASRSEHGGRLWGEVADWGKWEGMADRYAVARYTALVLHELGEGRVAPDVPAELDADLRDRMAGLRQDLTALVARHGPVVEAALGGAGR